MVSGTIPKLFETRVSGNKQQGDTPGSIQADQMYGQGVENTVLI